VDGECTVCILSGSLIGLVHVEEVVNPEAEDGSAWVINQSMRLRKPIQCAAPKMAQKPSKMTLKMTPILPHFDGIWKMSEYLSEVIL